MELTLIRDGCGADCTLGQLFVNGRFDCYTVEDPVRDAGTKVHAKTAIPEGRYRVVVTHSPRFGRDLPLLQDVPNFEGIRIHPGNTAEDTAGCILPGLARTPKGVAQSRAAFEQLFGRLRVEVEVGGEIWISVTGLAPAPVDRASGTRHDSERGESDAQYFRP